MSIQECALYGDLVLWLCDRAAELLAEAKADSTVEAETARLDELIRSWFFTPQDELHGCAPRDLIWAEQMGRPNPIPTDRLDDFFFDDCPICQQMQAEVETAELEGHEHGWQWFYDDGGYPLIARYDPEGWDARWAEEEADLEDWQAEQEQRQTGPAPPYAPPPVDSKQVDPETFMEVLRRPWLDPELHKVAQKLAGCCDVPVPGDRFGTGYRRLTRPEATSLVAGLHQQGMDVLELMAQIEAWPYQNVALDWLSDPEKNVAVLCLAMETEIHPDDEAELARFRQHRDFILTLARLTPPGARLWLQGWLEAVTHGAFAAPDIPF
jgi:hypothetical protein